MAKRYELSDAQWVRIAELLPGKRGDRGRIAKDNGWSTASCGCCVRAHAGATFRTGMVKWKSVHKRFTRWAKVGVWERVFTVIGKDRRNEYLMLNTSLVRAH